MIIQRKSEPWLPGRRAAVTMFTLWAALVCPAAGYSQSNGFIRPPIEQILPRHFGWGVSCFGGAKQWPEEMKKKHGIRWDYLYVYIFPKRTKEGYVRWLFDRAEKMQAIPILSFYGLLQLGREAGYRGREQQIVNQMLADKAAMRTYFEEVKRILQMCARFKKPVIFHSEPDSWAFMLWVGLTMKTRDPNQTEAMVKSSGMPDVSAYPDTVAGFAKALLHLRDITAPNTYMGFHAKDCRAGLAPEKMVAFLREIGKWDILIGDGIGHVLSTRSSGWWDAFDEKRFARYMKWCGMVTRETGLKYMHWQSVLGKSDYTLLPDYPARERVSDYIRAGSVACFIDFRVRRGGDPHRDGRSDPNHGYTARPPAGHPAQNTPAALVARLSRYYQEPIYWRKDRPPAAEKKKRILVERAAEPDPLAAHADSLHAAIAHFRAGRYEEAAAGFQAAAVEIKEEPARRIVAAYRTASESARRLREVIVAGTKRGRHEHVYVDLAGTAQRVRLQQADPDQITVVIGGSELPLTWRMIGPQRFCGIAAKYVSAESAAEQCALAYFAAACGLAELADRAMSAAVLLDKERLAEKPRVKALAKAARR